ncbi:hypothetical protein EB093_04565 [bacterium]|nr:hypothetical protein [bacterium]
MTFGIPCGVSPQNSLESPQSRDIPGLLDQSVVTRIDSSQLLAKLTGQLVYLHDRVMVIKTVGAMLIDAMNLASAVSISRDTQDKTHFLLVDISSDQVVHRFPETDPLLRYLQQHDRPHLPLGKFPEWFEGRLSSSDSHVLCVPLQSCQAVYGALILRRDEAIDGFTPLDTELMTLICPPVIAVLERIEFYEALQAANRELTELNVDLAEMTRTLEARIADEVAKKETAIVAATELTKNAQLSAIAVGVAHEIRNPMSAMQAKAFHLRWRLENAALTSLPVNPSDLVFTDQVTIAQLAMATSTTDAPKLWDWLRQSDYIDEAGRLNPQTFKPYSPSFSTELPRHLIPYESTINTLLVKLRINRTIADMLSIVDSESARVERLCDTMVAYGTSGKGVSTMAFSGIVGAESDRLWHHLVSLGYLDENGMIQADFRPDDPSFEIRLPPEFQRWHSAILGIISSTDTAKKTAIDINQSITDLLNLFEGAFHHQSIHVVADLDPHAGSIWGHVDDLKQVLINITRNALQAMGTPNDLGHRLTISTQYLGRSEERSIDSQIYWLEVAITDTGVGISPTLLPSIMDPFFSTSVSCSGDENHLGLGLSIVNQIVRRIGGTIAIESEIGVGTTVRLNFRSALTECPIVE